MAQVGHFPTTISDEVGKYQLTVAGYSGDAGDAMTAPRKPDYIANGRMFSTPDSDNDANPDINCAVRRSCGWWFGKCGRSDINKITNGIWTTGGKVYDVQASRMLVKLN